MTNCLHSPSVFISSARLDSKLVKSLANMVSRHSTMESYILLPQDIIILLMWLTASTHPVCSSARPDSTRSRWSRWPTWWAPPGSAPGRDLTSVAGCSDLSFSQSPSSVCQCPPCSQFPEIINFSLLVMDFTWKTKKERKGNAYFNDTLNTFYLRLYGVRHMVKHHSDSERENPLPPHGLLFSIDSKGSFMENKECYLIRQDNTIYKFR